MMTMEQYLQVAQMSFAEQQEGFNPFDGSEDDYMLLASHINDGSPGTDQMNEDGWVGSGNDILTA